MGYSSYTADAARALHSTTDARKGKDTSSYFTAPVGRAIDAAEVPKEVNPLGVTFREARDSDAHPNSKGIFVAFDTTSSMSHFPKIFATEALPKLMTLLVQKNFCEDPAVLFSAFNDSNNGGGHAVQVGQFESGLEIDDDLTKLPLQGGGGGSMEENAEMAIYFAARHTAMDCWEKRGQKGYLFILTDEKPYPTVKASQVKQYIGDELQGDIKVEEIIAEASKTFEVFCVLAGTNSYAGMGATSIRNRWVDLLGEEHVLTLQDAKGAAELIASTVGIYEGRLDGDNLVSDLTSHGVDATIAGNVMTALAPLRSSGRHLARSVTTGVVPAPSTTSGGSRIG